MAKVFGSTKDGANEKRLFGEIENGDLFFLNGTLFVKVEDTKGLVLGSGNEALHPAKKGEAMELSFDTEVLLSIVDFCM